MLVIGVTGGVGSGKTTFVQTFERLGATIINADMLAKELTDKNDKIRTALKNKFGPGIFNRKGVLQRRKLGRLAFSNTRSLKLLNNIIGPALIKEIKNKISTFRKNEKTATVIVDIAILFEAGIESQFDKIIVITAPVQNRIKWLRKERNWHEEEILERMRSQMGIEEMRRRADIVVDNSGTIQELRQCAREIYNKSTV